MTKREAKIHAIRCIVPDIHTVIYSFDLGNVLIKEYGYSQQEADKIVEQMEEIANQLQKKGEKMGGKFNPINGEKED